MSHVYVYLSTLETKSAHYINSDTEFILYMYIYHYQNPRREKRALYHDNPVLAFYADDSPVKETKPIQTTETRSSTENRNRKKKRKEKSVSGNNRPAVVDGLGGVLDLEDAAVGGEGGDGEIVARSYAAHCSASILFLVDLMFRSERVWTVFFDPNIKKSFQCIS